MKVQPILRRGAELEEVVHNLHGPPRLMLRNRACSSDVRIRIPGERFQREKNGSEWITQLVCDGRQRLLC